MIRKDTNTANKDLEEIKNERQATLWNRNLYRIPELSPPQVEICPHERSLPILLPQSLATTDLLPISVVLPVLFISCKWSHALCGLFCLAAFTRHDVFKIHPHCRTCHCFPFYGRIIFHWVDLPDVHLLICQWILELFPVLDYCKWVMVFYHHFQHFFQDEISYYGLISTIFHFLFIWFSFSPYCGTG